MIKLKELRKNLGKTQEDMAKLLNISQTSYGKYELGIAEPDINSLKILADYFYITIDELVEHKTIFENLSKNKKALLNQIMLLNDTNTLLALAYCKGLYANQE